MVNLLEIRLYEAVMLKLFTLEIDARQPNNWEILLGVYKLGLITLTFLRLKVIWFSQCFTMVSNPLMFCIIIELANSSILHKIKERPLFQDN